jgi:zinc protease
MRSLRLLALLLPLPAVAAAQGAAPIRVPYVLDSLDNGLRFIIHEDRSAPVVAVNVWYHVGSGDEKPGRTGFAHLFEHLMFMGSQHAPYPAFDRLLEGAGANNNGSTTEDRTNYFEVGPVNALPLMLWLEADRMGWMLPTMDSAKVDLQRDVVKNERRQSYENQPYGMVWDHLPTMLYPAGHTYSWPVIGSMVDLSAASVEDVKQFFREYYAPNNAVIVVAGDVRADSVRTLMRTYFGAIPRGPGASRPRPVLRTLARDTALVLEDRVQLARLYYAWPAVKETNPDNAAFTVISYLLTGAKNGRLTQPLVYDRQIASNVQASGDLKRHDGDFLVIATARPGQSLPAIQQVVDAEIARLAAEGPTPRELEQARNALEARFLGRLETVMGKADQLNGYYYERGTPDGFQADLDALRAVTAEDVQRVTRNWLLGPRAIISVVPQGKPELAAAGRVTP